MGVVLTAGGKTAPNPATRSRADLLDAWDRAVTKMLETAAASTPARQRLEKMQAWFANDDNRWHEKYDERHAEYWHAKMAANAISSKLMDMATDVSHLQKKMDPEMLAGLGALVGRPLYPHISQQFAIWSQRTGSTDLFDVVRAWLVAEWEQDQIAEEEIAS